MPDLAEARAAYNEAWLTAVAAYEATLAGPRATYERAIARARASGTQLTRNEVRAWLEAGTRARDIEHQILAGPRADIQAALHPNQPPEE